MKRLVLWSGCFPWNLSALTKFLKKIANKTIKPKTHVKKIPSNKKKKRPNPKKQKPKKKRMRWGGKGRKGTEKVLMSADFLEHEN